jgi:signal transduction histidine kinase
MQVDSELVITAVVLSLIVLVLVAFYIALIVAAQNRKIRFDAERKSLHQAMLIEVANAEKEATQNTLSLIGRELHDNVGQLLTATHLGMTHHFGDELEESEDLQRVLSTLEACIDEVGRLGRALNNEFWQRRDLFDAIVDEAARLEHLGTFMIPVEHDGEKDGLSNEERVMLFRAFQEIVQNAIKYSRARTLSIKLQSSPLLIHIADDGKGFNTEVHSLGSGILNVKKRCDLVNMSAVLTSQPEKGTTWTITRKRTNTK